MVGKLTGVDEVELTQRVSDQDEKNEEVEA